MLKKLIEKRDHFREEVSRNPNAYWGRRLIIFLLIVGLMLFYLVRVFDMNDTKHSEQVFQAYYKLPKNTVTIHFIPMGWNLYRNALRFQGEMNRK